MYFLMKYKIEMKENNSKVPKNSQKGMNLIKFKIANHIFPFSNIFSFFGHGEAFIFNLLVPNHTYM